MNVINARNRRMILKNFWVALFVLILLCFKMEVYTQALSLQVNTGLINYGGDLQTKPFTFNQSQLTAGAALIYRVKNFALRAGFNYGNVKADDNKTARFAARNLNFKSAITEGSLCLEYNFFQADPENKFMPYIFAGIGFYHFNPYTFFNSQKVFLRPLSTEGEGLSVYPDRKVYTLTNFEDPFGIGFKYKLSSNFLIGIEFNSRLLYSDYLDDVSTTYPDQSELFKAKGQLAVDLSYRGDEINTSTPYPTGKGRGNPRQNDNYYTSVLTMTYIFPDHGLFGQSSARGRHSINCPKKVH